MRILVDARNLTRPMSGIARSMVEMIEALAGAGSKVHLAVPGPVHAHFEHLQDLSNCTVHAGHATSVAGRLVWGRTDLPALVDRLAPTIFWAPAHRLSTAVARRVATVLTIHDLTWKQAPDTMLAYRRWGERAQMAEAVRAARQITAVSHHTATTLAAHYRHAAGKICVVYNAVSAPPRPADAGCLLQLGIAGPFCLFVSTIEPRKNIVRMIEAFAGLPDAMDGDLTLVLAGARGWRTGSIDAALERHGACVRWIGPVDDATRSLLYRQSRAVLMPSLYEGFGYPVIEAQQFGKTVVTSAGSAMEEIGGPFTVLVDPLDVGSIRQGIERALRIDAPPVADMLAFHERYSAASSLAAFQRACARAI